MPGIFGGPLFGKQAPTQGLDPDQAQSLGIIQAMQQSQNAGMQRTASPMGSIAQNLLPIFAAMIYSKAAQAQSAKQAQDEALNQQSAQADIDYKKALTDKARRPDGLGGSKDLQEVLARRIEAGQPFGDVVAAIKQTQKPAQTEWGARLDVAGGDPAKALELKRQDEQAHAQMMGQAAESLRQQKMAADEQKRLNQPAEKTNTYAYSPETGNRMSTARQADLDSGSAIKLSGNDQRAWTNTKDAWRQLDELEKLVPELLPDKGGVLNTPSTLIKGQYGRRTGDPRWTNFDQLASFLKFPVLQATVRGRPPLSESKTIREVSDTDTKDSAMGKINEFRSQLLGIGDTLGFSPNAIKYSAYPSPTNEDPGANKKPGFEVDMDKQALERAYNELKAKYPKATDAELATLYRSRLASAVGQ